MRLAAFLLLPTCWCLVLAQTITVRSLDSTSSSSSLALPTSASFVFDGTNSDMARQLYIRHKAGDSGPKLSLTSVPAAVAQRLNRSNLDFKDLPGLVQRAVLWDSGFAVSPGHDPVQIWTMGDYSMADIAIPKADVANVDCTFLNCSQPNNETAYFTKTCTGYQILNASRCVVDVFKDPGAGSFLGTMWSTGGDHDMAPQIRLREHTWTEYVKEFSGSFVFSVYSVHTVPSNEDSTWNVCPSGYGSLTVPCIPRNQISDAYMAANTTLPTGSAWVTTWLEEEFATPPTPSTTMEVGLDKLLLIPILLGVIVAFSTLGSGLIWWRRRAATAKAEVMNIEACDVDDGFSPSYCGVSQSIATTRHWTTPTSPHWHLSGDYEAAGCNKTLRILLGSQHLNGKRIPYNNLVFQQTISKGGSGEVWICEYNQQKMAAKRLQDQTAEKVHAFAEEIELSASLVHPHIVEFIGVAWSSLSNLVMLLEYVPGGTLRSFLNTNAELLSWARCKIDIAIGIAQALDYLHDRTPPLIHRDLKSTNILLTDRLEPKLIDFGVSRGLVDITMTAGVGTPYWTAPEILEGKRYTEQADVYSFGVVLSELDTGNAPYSADESEGRARLNHLQILKGVVAGTLRPTFSSECPLRIQRVGQACLAHNPVIRPTAQQLLRELEGDGDELMYDL